MEKVVQEVTYEDRIVQLSDEEFDALERYASGRLVNIAQYFFLLTDGQVHRLHSDDFSYYYELVEELNYETQLNF